MISIFHIIESVFDLTIVATIVAVLSHAAINYLLVWKSEECHLIVNTVECFNCWLCYQCIAWPVAGRWEQVRRADASFLIPVYWSNCHIFWWVEFSFRDLQMTTWRFDGREHVIPFILCQVGIVVQSKNKMRSVFVMLLDHFRILVKLLLSEQEFLICMINFVMLDIPLHE